MALALICGPAGGHAAAPYYLRNHNPFLQVFGLPAPEGGQLLEPGTTSVRVSFALANHADSSETGTESVVLDGESYFSDVRLRFAPAPRWELGLDVPHVAHRDGRLDNLIEGWHSTFGLSNGQRRGPSNELQLTYVSDGIARADIRSGASGLGDVRLTTAYQLHKASGGRRSIALRGLVKLPTGKASALRGSGDTDVALGLDATDELLLEHWSVDVFGQAGVLVPGDGKVLNLKPDDVVPFASVGAAWPWRRNVELHLQLALQDDYFDSALPDLGGGTASLAVGATFRVPRLGVAFDLALMEDLISDATPDFGLYLSIASLGDHPR